MYDIIYSDPPWQQQKGGIRKARPNQKRPLDYPTLELDDIKDIHRTFSSKANPKHNFFVWTIEKYLDETKQMMAELGYTLHARMIWDKENGVAPAFTVRFSHEYLLWFYKKGNMLMPCAEMRGKQTTVFREPATKHSKKPIYAYEMLERMFPETNKVELFARTNREGWGAFGNEVENSIAI